MLVAPPAKWSRSEWFKKAINIMASHNFASVAGHSYFFAPSSLLGNVNHDTLVPPSRAEFSDAAKTAAGERSSECRRRGGWPECS